MCTGPFSPRLKRERKAPPFARPSARTHRCPYGLRTLRERGRFAPLRRLGAQRRVCKKKECTERPARQPLRPGAETPRYLYAPDPHIRMRGRIARLTPCPRPRSALPLRCLPVRDRDRGSRRADFLVYIEYVDGSATAYVRRADAEAPGPNPGRRVIRGFSSA